MSAVGVGGSTRWLRNDPGGFSDIEPCASHRMGARILGGMVVTQCQLTVGHVNNWSSSQVPLQVR